MNTTEIAERKTEPLTEREALPLPPDHKLFIVSLRCGRLGNRLILFAHLIATVAELRHRLINFTFHSYSHLFEATRHDIYCQYPAPKRRSWMDVVPGVSPALRKTRLCYHVVRTANKLHERFPIRGRAVTTLYPSPDGEPVALDGPQVRDQIREAKTVFVQGWRFQSPPWIERHAAMLRSYFRPIEELESSSREGVSRLRRDADVVIGMHVRMGDYRTWRGGKFFFPPERYARWMGEVAEQFPGRKVAFLLCSDEPELCRELLGPLVQFGPGSPVSDMYALAECDYIFGTVSTFTQWASFYGGKPLFSIYRKDDVLNLDKFRVSYLDVPSDRKLKAA